jgi:hypothetical protein
MKERKERVNWGKFLGLLLVIVIVLIALAIGPFERLIETRWHEAQARNAAAQAQQATAQAELEREKNERLQIRPLAFAAFADTSLNIVYVILDRVLLFVAIVLLAIRRQRNETA